MNLINNIYKQRFLYKNKKFRYFNILNDEFKNIIFYNLDDINCCYYDYNLNSLQLNYINHKGEYHRDNDKSGNQQPSVIGDDGTLFYHINGILHRESDLPAIYYGNSNPWQEGDMVYMKNYKYHRDDDIYGNPQPAIIYGTPSDYNNYIKCKFYKNGFFIEGIKIDKETGFLVRFTTF